MKALMLAAVMALGATGASALDTNTLLTKGTVIAALNPNANSQIWVSFEGKIYKCADKQSIKCWLNKNATVEE